MKKLFWIGLIFISACQTGSPDTIQLSYKSKYNAAPGTVISQHIEKDLGNGFFEVGKSIVNPPEIWEGLGHFTFVYYGKTEICQCFPIDVVISPKGKYVAYYSHEKKRWILYNTKHKKTSVIPDVPIGYPMSAEWNKNEKTLALSLSRYRNGEVDKVHQIILN